MRFLDVLEQRPMPSRVGDVLLRYEPALLIGEARRRPGALPALALAGSLGCGLGSLLALLLPAGAGPAVALAVTLGASAALLAGLGAALEARSRAVRRFVLNYATESLRLERSSGLYGLPRTRIVRFDAVRALEVVERPSGRFALRVEYAPSPDAPALRAEVLVDRAHPAEVPALRRVWWLLRSSFGLKAPAAPPSSG